MILTYYHGRSLFIKNKWKSFVEKYFKDIEFIGFDFGYYFPSIKISNWEEIKDKLSKSYKPLYISNTMDEMEENIKKNNEYRIGDIK